MAFLRKFLKNKVLVVSICVIVVSLIYMGVQKLIDNYNFNNNSDIIEANDFEKQTDTSDSSKDGGESEENKKIENGEKPKESEGTISKEETDLVLEEKEEDTTDAQKIEDNTNEESEIQNKIYVYITGEVNYPGVVVLNEGSRIVDAINAAGGTTANANISKVNLVYILDDGMKVNIPNNTDLKDNLDFEYITMSSGDGRNDEYISSTDGDNTSSNLKADNDSSGSRNGNRYDIVNINTATQTELETLPGIGPSLALKIINYRKENGNFSSIEQIKDVSGIGENKFENMKSYITI